MRYFLFFIVCILTLILILLGINPHFISSDKDSNHFPDAILFKKAMANISKLRAIIENCPRGSSENNEVIEGTEEAIAPGQKLLKELELMLAYQNKVIAHCKYEEIQNKSLKREVSFADVQKAYRELESAELYLSRLLENYPQGTELLNNLEMY